MGRMGCCRESQDSLRGAVACAYIVLDRSGTFLVARFVSLAMTVSQEQE